MLARLCAAQSRPAVGRRGGRRVPPDHVGVPRARAEASHRAISGPPGRSATPRSRAISASSSTRVPCATIDEMFRAAESGQADYAVVPVENSTEGAVGRTLDLMCTTELSICGEIKLRVAAEPAVATPPTLERVAKRVFARAVARAMRAMARAPSAGRARASRWRATPRRRACGRRARAPRRSPARSPRRSTASPMLAAQHRGRAQQHDAILGARAPADGRRPAATRRRCVMSAPNRPGALHRAAGAVRAPWRVDDARRVAAGAQPACGSTCSSSTSSATREDPRGRRRARRTRAATRPSSSCSGRTRRRIASTIRHDHAPANPASHDATAASRPEYIRAHRAVRRAASRSTSWRARSGSTRRRSSSSRRTRIRAVPSPAVARGDRGGDRRHRRAIRTATASRSRKRWRSASTSTRDRSCSATAATTCSSSLTQAFLQARRRRRLLAVRLRRLSAGHAGARRARRRGAGARLRPRSRRDARSDHAGNAHRVHRQSRTIRPEPGSPPMRSRPSSRAVPPT